METTELTAIATEAAKSRTYEIWVVEPGSKIAVKQMTEQEAKDVYNEFVRQYRAENWNPIDVHRIPRYLSKLQKGSALVVVGIVNTASHAPCSLPHWLTRVPSQAVAS